MAKPGPRHRYILWLVGSCLLCSLVACGKISLQRRQLANKIGSGDLSKDDKHVTENGIKPLTPEPVVDDTTLSLWLDLGEPVVRQANMVKIDFSQNGMQQTISLPVATRYVSLGDKAKGEEVSYTVKLKNNQGTVLDSLTFKAVAGDAANKYVVLDDETSKSLSVKTDTMPIPAVATPSDPDTGPSLARLTACAAAPASVDTEIDANAKSAVFTGMNLRLRNENGDLIEDQSLLQVGDTVQLDVAAQYPLNGTTKEQESLEKLQSLGLAVNITASPTSVLQAVPNTKDKFLIKALGQASLVVSFPAQTRTSPQGQTINQPLVTRLLPVSIQSNPITDLVFDYPFPNLPVKAARLCPEASLVYANGKRMRVLPYHSTYALQSASPNVGVRQQKEIVVGKSGVVNFTLSYKGKQRSASLTVVPDGNSSFSWQEPPLGSLAGTKIVLTSTDLHGNEIGVGKTLRMQLLHIFVSELGEATGTIVEEPFGLAQGAWRFELEAPLRLLTRAEGTATVLTGELSAISPGKANIKAINDTYRVQVSREITVTQP